jgi:hypothetical protein
MKGNRFRALKVIRSRFSAILKVGISNQANNYSYALALYFGSKMKSLITS